MNLLVVYPWPENARQLESVIEQALSVCDGDTILPEHLPDEISQ
jgi:two-component system NtrC family response regulator